jgi:uncharacterized membrane protein
MDVEAGSGPAGARGTSGNGGWHAGGVTPEQLAWGVASPPRSYWPARVAVVAAMGLYLVLPSRLVPGPRVLVPVLEGVVLVVLTVTTPHRTIELSQLRRMLATVLVAIITVANLINLGLLVHELLRGGINNGRELVFSSIAIWLTNVIVFGLWYWELDRGGPGARHDPDHREPDFLFPQMTTPGAGRPDWAPGFVDYLYVSFTNATAFSPTDTMPLTQAAKALMTVQSAGSLLTVALVAARAVNILS